MDIQEEQILEDLADLFMTEKAAIAPAGENDPLKKQKDQRAAQGRKGLQGGGGAGKGADTKAKEAADRRAKLKGKFGGRVGGTPDEEVVSVADEKPPVFDAPAGETKKLKPRKARKGEGLGVGARKRQGAGKPQSAAPKHGGQVRFQ